MALTGQSHRPGKITATTHLPSPLANAPGVVLAPPSCPATAIAGHAPRQGTELATTHIPSKARACQYYRAYSAIWLYDRTANVTFCG
jgi:hypothetical protein